MDGRLFCALLAACFVFQHCLCNTQSLAAAPPRAAAFLAPYPGRLRAPDLCACERGVRALRVRGGAAAARMGQDLMLVTNKMCPFAQKAWIVLEEKKAAHGVDFTLEEIGLYGGGGKPAWFLKMNPKGLVPVLKHGDRVVVESDDILKYIDANVGVANELTQGKGASVDDWLKLLADVRSAGKDCVLGYGTTEKLKGVLARVEAAIESPYMKGDSFSLADVAAAPFFQRMMTEQRKVGLSAGEFPKIYAWWALVEKRPSFASTVVKSWWWWW